MKPARDLFLALLSDNSVWLQELSYQLQKNSFKTVSVESIDDAMVLHEIKKPDLFITDNPRTAAILKRLSIGIFLVMDTSDIRHARNQIIQYLFPPGRKKTRSHERFHVDFDASLEPSDLAEITLSGKVMNISQEGIFICPQEVLPQEGEVLDLEFVCFHECPLTFEALAIVRWVRKESSPVGFGAEFISMTEVSADFLHQVCKTSGRRETTSHRLKEVQEEPGDV